MTNTDDPFLPPLIDELVIDFDLTEKHRMVLNKYPITKSHVLIITKDFEHQTTPLDIHDIQACLVTMRAQNPGIVYFNAGREAGASQPHKHMQCFPESNFTTTMGKPPLSLALDRYLKQNKVDYKLPFRYPKFDFKHEIRFFDTDLFYLIDNGYLDHAADIVYDHYQDAFRNMGIQKGESSNFALTKDYLLIVPREREFFEGVSCNSLNFVGTFFAETDTLLQHMEHLGPLNMLKAVTKSV